MVGKHHLKQWILLFFYLLLFGVPLLNANANTNNDFGVWGATLIQGRFSKKSKTGLDRWLWWAEAQGRLFQSGTRLGQTILRPAIGYKLSKDVSVWLGYGWIYTSPVGKDATNEHRIWQQVIWSHAFSWGKLISRTRLEQRFLVEGRDAGWRFRQFIKYASPTFWRRFYLSIWDEVFININGTDWGAKQGLGQNRIFVGLGVFFDPKLQHRFELGYLNQLIYREKGDLPINHLVSVNFFLRFL